MSFTITSNISWSIESDQEWCLVSSTSGSNNATITVNVTENSTTSSRSATITINSNDTGSVKVSVTQAGADSDLQLNKNNLLFTTTGGSDSFTITSNTNWTVTSDQTWCTVSTSSGSNNGTITVTVSENTSTDSREASITVKAGDVSQSIAVIQEGAKAQDTRQKLNLRFNENDVKMEPNDMVYIGFTHDGDPDKLDRSQFSCEPDWYFVDLVNGYVGGLMDTPNETYHIDLIFAGNDYYLPESISISYRYSPPLTFTVNGVSFKMIHVVGGTFMMGATSEQGSDASDLEKPTHQVTLSSYFIGEIEVTQELWQAVMDNNPSSFQEFVDYNTGRRDLVSRQKPVECVSWNDCQEFIRKLNSLTGRNFRLPTEAEWEYAARGGNKSRGYKYAGSNTIGNVAWYDENSNAETHEVATKSANELGLYDMSGNVWEWCSDWYGSYSSGSQTNPIGPSSGGTRVCRGGGWIADVGDCRVSFRAFTPVPVNRFNYLGLRLVLQ